MKPILLHGRPLAPPGLAAVCVPLVARDAAALLREAQDVAALRPDLVEWRVDFFEGIARTDAVVALAGALRHALGGVPLLWTRRSVREGGQPIPIDEAQVAALYRAVCDSGHVALVDAEMSGDAQHLAALREHTRRSGVGLVLSFHDFQSTPSVQELLQRFRQAERLGADVAKVAVMPRDMGDVLTLLTATWQASEELAIPVVSMAMGGLGAVSRVAGMAFGSALSFGMGQAASAPGQWPVADLQQSLHLLRQAMGEAAPR